MKINCFLIQHDLRLISCNYEYAVEVARNQNAKVWFDVQGTEADQLEVLLDQLEVRDLARRLCIEARERPGFYPLNAFILMVIPVAAAEEDLRNVEYVTLLCRKNLLLTLRTPRESPIQQITTWKESSDWLHDDSIEGLTATIMMILSLDSLQQLTGLREHVTVLENRLDHEPEQVDISGISDKRSRLLTLEAVVSGQLPVLEALMATDKSFFGLENAREHLVNALANLKAADRSLHWLEGRLEVIRSDFDMRSQDKMNHRLTRLTILSTIFMPITFLAGIWGMNFENMPALRQPYGYLMAIGLMILIGGGMFFYFRWKGWFE